MNTSAYEFLSILQVGKNSEEKKEKTDSSGYLEVLDSVRSEIARNHAEELSAALDDAEAAQSLKTLIYRYAAEHLAGEDYDRSALTERIFEDMAGLGILTKYLHDPTVEEININAYNQPAVEAGKKAATALITLQQNILRVLETEGAMPAASPSNDSHIPVKSAGSAPANTTRDSFDAAESETNAVVSASSS